MADKIEIEILGKDSSSGAFKSASSGIGGLLKTAAGFATGLGIFGMATAAIGGVGNVIKGAATAAEEEQSVFAQTAAVIKSTGDASGMTAQQVADMANHFQDVTTFGNEAVQSGENMLLTFTGIGKDVFPQATATMLDMSQALGQDLQSSAIQLGKALNDPVKGITALQRVGVTFTDEQKKQIQTMVDAGDVMGAQKVILNELGREFGGSATAATKSFAGQMAQAKNQIGDAEKAISYALLPVLANLATKALPSVISVIQWLGREAPVAIGFISRVVERVSAVLSGPFHAAWVMVRDAVITFIEALSGNWTDNSKIEGVHRVIGNIGLVIRNQVIPAVTALARWFVGTAVPAIQQFAQMAVQFITGQVIPAFQRFAAAVMPIVSTVLGFIREHFAQIAGVIAIVVVAFQTISTVVGVISSVIAAIGAFSAAVSAAGGVIAVIVAVLGGPLTIAIGAIALIVAGLYIAWQTNFLNIQGIVAAVWAAVQPVLAAIVANLQQFIADVLPKLSAAWQSLQEIVTKVVQSIAPIVEAVFGAIASFLSAHSEQIKAILSGAWEVISGIIKVDVAVIEGVIKTFLDLLSGNWSGAWNDIKTMLSGVWDGIKEIIGGALIVVQNEISMAIDAIKALFNGARSWLTQAGKDIVQGLIDGIEAMAGAVVSAAQSIIDKIPSTVRKLLGIASPSTVMMEIGRNIMQGLMLGVGSQSPALQAQWSGIAGGFTAGYGGGGRSSGSGSLGRAAHAAAHGVGGTVNNFYAPVTQHVANPVPVAQLAKALVG